MDLDDLFDIIGFLLTPDSWPFLWRFLVAGVAGAVAGYFASPSPAAVWVGVGVGVGVFILLWAGPLIRFSIDRITERRRRAK